MAIYSEFSHEKWWFSIAMLVYQRVCRGMDDFTTWENMGKLDLLDGEKKPPKIAWKDQRKTVGLLDLLNLINPYGFQKNRSTVARYGKKFIFFSDFREIHQGLDHQFRLFFEALRQRRHQRLSRLHRLPTVPRDPGVSQPIFRNQVRPPWTWCDPWLD